jgi:hypothetical protein
MRMIVRKIVVNDEHRNNILTILGKAIYCMMVDYEDFLMMQKEVGTYERFLRLRFLIYNC